jgi:hypothetical protein
MSPADEVVSDFCPSENIFFFVCKIFNIPIRDEDEKQPEQGQRRQPTKKN